MLKRLLVSLGTIAVVGLFVLAFLPSGGNQTLVLSFDGLPRLGDNGYWEGWAVVDAEPWSTGKFNVSEGGELVSLDGSPTGGEYPLGIDLSGATLVVISRHHEDDNLGPQAPHFLAGEVVDGEATLDISFPAAVGIDFDDARGEYTLVEGGFDLGVRVPKLPAGWAYEVWVEDDGTAMSLGTFGGSQQMPAKDGVMHKPGMEPANQGELSHAMAIDGIDPRGGTIKLTLEPVPDDSPEPFAVTVLEAAVPAGAEAGVQHELNASSTPLPTGRATIK